MKDSASRVSDVFWRDRSVFVTGGTGLIGSWVVKQLLRAGARVCLLIKDTHPGSELLRSGDLGRCAVAYGELEDFATLENAINLHESDTVIHLAAQTLVGVAHRSPFATFESNVRGTYNLLEACRMHRNVVGRIVIASSDKAYGEKDVLPYTESMSLDAVNTYDVSKSCADFIGRAYARTYEMPIAITRFGNVYGGGDLNWSRIVPGTIMSLLRGERPAIRSDGTFTRDYLYVEDVAAGYLRLAEAIEALGMVGEAFNFSAENRMSALDVVRRIGGIMGRTDLEPDIRNDARGEIRHQHLSARKARDMLGWKAEVEIGEGLARTVDWYRSYLSSMGT